MSDLTTDGAWTYVRRIVDTMQKELDDLIRQKRNIRRQMRSLKRSLHRFPSGSGSAGRSGTALKSQQFSSKAGRPRGRKFERLQFELKRACRIAFMDAGGVATPDQICCSITRRGSFSFINLRENPTEMIVCILNLMAETGEVQPMSSDPRSGWTYTFKNSSEL